uniref:COP9 signalosome complex subunit 5 n=1 Tax=Lotharella oceanica TaxID=641309 RepID=A0A7S2TWV7_9EUKA
MDKEADGKYYAHDAAAIKKVMDDKPWEKNPKNFAKCNISALAGMRMLKHALSGVKKGRARDGGKGLPLEVMGLMVGRPSADSITVLDAIPLPCDGFESEWNVNISQKAMMLMIKVQERIEAKGTKEEIIGWYHSHPFEVGVHNNCFMSAIDVNTQSMYQKAIKKHWTAVVVDPLRCVAKSKLEMSAFRAYPDHFKPPADQAPDGEPIRENAGKNWGTYPERYYQLQTKFFMSSIARSTMDLFSKDSLWIRILSNSKIDDEEYAGKVIKRIGKATTKMAASIGVARYEKGSNKDKPNPAVEDSTKIAHELCTEQTLGILRHALFCGCKRISSAGDSKWAYLSSK